MINLTITLKTSEINSFKNFVDRLFLKSWQKIDAIDYYNLRYFQKKLFDKIYTLSSGGHQTQRKISIPVNINIYDTLLRLYEYNKQEIDKPENSFYNILFNDIILQLSKKVVNLNRPKTPFLD
jgi:hypothetical protein